MPTVTSVKQVLRMEDGAEVAAFKGKVLKVFPRKTGTSERGRDWSKQELICQEGDRDVKVVLWGHDAQQNLVGRVIYIEAGHEAIIAEDNVWKGKTTRQLKVSESATITLDGAAPQSEEDPPEQTPSRQFTPQKNGSMKSYQEAHVFTGKAANAMILSLRAAAHVGKTLEKESKLFLTPELFQQIAHDVFRAMLSGGFVDAMPVKAIAPPRELKAPEPKPSEAYQPGDESEPPPKAKAEPPPETKPEPEEEMDDVPF